MSSPSPVDPYLALGIAKDAELSTIRSAHRKLVLKFHPDRIKDEAERVKGREEFQRVQQAYELLSDPAKRARYDDKVRLAELRKEALDREIPVRASAYPMPPSQFSAGREFRDGRYYEERVPRETTFFDDEDDRYRPEPPRPSARRDENYERKTSSGYTEKKSTNWKAGGISIDIALKLQKKAASAKEKVRDARAATAKSRDQERRRDASAKHSSRRAYVEDDSSSDSDTATYFSVNQKAEKVSSPSSMPRRSRPDQTERKESQFSDDDDDDDVWTKDKHQGLHALARDYIYKAAPGRPRELHRQDSSHSYFEPRDDRSHARRSGRDREDRRKERDRPKTSGWQRPSYPEIEILKDVRSRKIPNMPTATSSPANLRIPEDRREAPQPRRSTTTQAAQDHRKEVPQIARSHTMPYGGSARQGDNARARGSNLKHAETHDSGYGSSSPATPDTNGTSPPKYASATRYHIVDEAEEFSRGHYTILVEPEDSNRRTRSPSSQQRRPILSASGKQTSRAATAYTPRSPVDVLPTRPSPSRHESTRSSVQPRDSQRLSKGSSAQHDRKTLYREISSDEQESGYSSRVSTGKVTSPRIRAHGGTRSPNLSRGSRDAGGDDDYYPGSQHRTELRHPGMGSRRPSQCV